MTVLLLLSAAIMGALVGLFIGTALAVVQSEVAWIPRCLLIGALAGLALGIGAAL